MIITLFPTLDLRGSTMSAWTAGNVTKCIVKCIKRMGFVTDQSKFHRHMIDKSSRWGLGWCWQITLANMENFMEIYWWCTQALSISCPTTCLNYSFMHHITPKCVLISAQLEKEIYFISCNLYASSNNITKLPESGGLCDNIIEFGVAEDHLSP